MGGRGARSGGGGSAGEVVIRKQPEPNKQGYSYYMTGTRNILSNWDVHAQIDYLKQHRIHIYPSCVNTIKEIQQWKWKKDEKTNTYLEEPVPFFDDAMAMLRYSIEEERKVRPRLNRNVKGGI